MSWASLIHGKAFLDCTREDGHRETVDILESVTTEVAESDCVCSSLEDHEDVQELDEEYFGSEYDELEAAKKGIIKHFKYKRFNSVFEVRGYDEGDSCWHYLLVEPDKKEVLLSKIKTGSLDIADYGRSLCSGWDKDPPTDITDKINEFFDERISNYLSLIKGEEKSYYHYVLVYPDKKEMFQKQSKKGLAFLGKIEDYSKILYSGWGQDPPESISDRITIAYFCTDERSLLEEFDNVCIKDDNALHAAARNGELEKVRYLIRKGATHVNSADKNGWTSLHHAAYGGNLEVAKYLLVSKADLHIKDTICSRKPIHIAAREGHISVIELFLSRGVKVNDADKSSWTPLHYAVWNGHLETAKLLINERADIHAKDATCGKKPVHVAAIKGHTDIVEIFLNKGVSVDEADKEGRTSLYYAASNGHLGTVKFLADKGANIHAENIHGMKPIHKAASDGDKNVIEFLLDRGAKVNDFDKNDWTPLNHASEVGELGVVRFLISKGANLHARIANGAKTIHIAAMSGFQAVMEFLISKGASIDDIDKNGETPLHYAAEAGKLEVIKLLIDKGANISAKNIVTGRKPIHSAAQFGRKNVIEFFLINRGINVDDTDNYSATPLLYAIVGNQLEVVKFLVNRGANIHNIIKDSTDEKPIHVAAVNSSRRIIEFLVSKGASVDDTNKNGETPLHLAASEGRLGIVKFLIDEYFC